MIKSILIIAVSIIIYVLGSNVFLKYINKPMYNSQGLGKNVLSDIGFMGYVDRIKMTYVHMLELFTNDYGNIFYYRLLIPIFLIMLIVFLIKLFVNKKTCINNKVVLAILLLVSPIIFDFSYVMAGITNNRVQTSLFFIILLPIVIDDKLYVENICVVKEQQNIKDTFMCVIKKLYQNIIKYGAIVFICLFIFISIGEHYNLYIHNKDFERNINYIVNKIYNHPDYKDGMRIITVGNYHKMNNEASMRDDFFAIHDKPIINNITWIYSTGQYFKMFGSVKLSDMADDSLKAMFSDMPSYPKDGCIKKISDNDLVIKFSD